MSRTKHNPAVARAVQPVRVDVLHLNLRYKRCAVCLGVLARYDRTVHRGACALARKTALQKERRQRARFMKAAISSAPRT